MCTQRYGADHVVCPGPSLLDAALAGTEDDSGATRPHSRSHCRLLARISAQRKGRESAGCGKEEKGGKVMQQETQQSSREPIDQNLPPATSAAPASGTARSRRPIVWLVLASILAACGYFVWRIFFATP